MAGSRRGTRDAGRNGATGVIGNPGKEPGVWKAEAEELVKRKGKWVRGEDSVMEPELRGWPMPGEQETEVHGAGGGVGDCRQAASAQGRRQRQMLAGQ